MSVHRTKRLFQPSLSTYLTRSPSSSSSSSSSATSFSTCIASFSSDVLDRNQESQSNSYLPTAIQSSLLSVGMRVRKAVPEGYKTFDDGYGYSTEDKENRIRNAGKDAQTKDMNRGNANGRKELAPYCAMLDVGGLCPQAHTKQGEDEKESVLGSIFDDEEGEWMSESNKGNMSSLTGITSLSSTILPSQTSTNRKRGFDCDGGLHQPIAPEFFDLDKQILRPIAQPRSRKLCRNEGSATIREEDEEMTDVKTSVIDDFEEAEFLQPV